MLRIIAVLVLLGALAITVAANAPHLLSYQGRLTDSNKNPVADGQYSVTFSLYSVSSGGSALWSETKSVTTSKGLFTTLLGSVTPLTPALFSDTTRYLGIKLGANAEMTPRTKLSSVAYAFQAVKADTAAYALAAPGGGGSGGWTDFGSEIFLTTNSDRVGIGTTSPTAKLQISGQGPDGKSFNANDVLVVDPAYHFVGVNRDSAAYPADAFGVHSTQSGLGGMSISTPGISDLPYYGYAPGGQLLAYHDYDGEKKQWRLWNNGSLGPVVDSLGHVNIQTSSIPSYYTTPAKLKVGGDQSSTTAFFHSGSLMDALYVVGANRAIHVNVPDINFSYDNSNPKGIDVSVNGVGANSGRAEGVWANATGGSTAAWGLHGTAGGSNENMGVRGEAFSGFGKCYGVYGTTMGNDICYGVYGEAVHPNASWNYAGYFVSNETGVSSEVGSYSQPSPRNTLRAFMGTTNGSTGAYSIGGSFQGVGAHRAYGAVCTGTSAIDTAFGILAEANGISPANIAVCARVSTTGSNFGVYSIVKNSASQTGVYAYASTAPTWSYAAWLDGKVNITGTLSKAAGSFKIDHPLDPENKYLQHSFVESPDMMNVYNGNSVLGPNGEATVVLPDYFEALNKDFRYQLTAIGAPGPNLYIAQEVTGNQFKIAGGAPGMKVSWQVTGIRHDPYANANRIQVEEDKDTDVRGLYLHPDVYSQPAEKGIGYKRFQAGAEKAETERAASTAPGQ